MVTRIRVEAEGSTTAEVQEILESAHETLGQVQPGKARRMMFGGGDEALADAQAGEFVIERFAREDGAIFYRGRMTSHYATPSKPRTLKQKSAEDPRHVD